MKHSSENAHEMILAIKRKWESNHPGEKLPMPKRVRGGEWQPRP